MTAALRFPFQPIADALATTQYRAAEHLGITGSTVQQTIARGITLQRAEQLAARIGRHPYELWPDMPEIIRGTGPRLDDPCGCSPRCPLTAGDPRHGTYCRAVRDYRCRCATCRAFRARRVAEQRRRRAAQPLAADDPRHGTPDLYRNHGCRCPACTTAASIDRELVRRRTTRRQATLR